MLPAALEHERLLIAERLLTEIERRHGLPHPRKRDIHPVITDRFLAAYLPEAREGEPAPLALEYAFAPSLKDALRLAQEVVSESVEGQGAALYIHDLDTGVTAVTTQLHSFRLPPLTLSQFAALRVNSATGAVPGMAPSSFPALALLAVSCIFMHYAEH